MEINLPSNLAELMNRPQLRNLKIARERTRKTNVKAAITPRLSQSEIEEQVASYRAWLVADAEYNLAQRCSEARQEYIETAQQTVQLGSRTIRAFAPFNYDISALTTFTRNQRIVIGAI